MTYNFNLTTEPWIPVRNLEDRLELLSLEDALLRAHTLHRIEDPSPLVVASLHRLLLTVLHRALRGPEDLEQAADWFEAGRLPAEPTKKYLERWRERFDLFSDTHPFYQVPDSEEKVQPISKLAAELSSGTNKLLFDHSQDAQPLAVSPAVSARLLLARQMLAVPEGAGYSPSPLGGTAVTIPQGATLFETLCLNLVTYDADETGDAPIWEEDAPTSKSIKENKERTALGLTNRYTWLSRSVRLEPERDERGETVVRWLRYTTGLKFLPGEVFVADPMLAYRRDEKRGNLPQGFRKGRGFWRDFLALVPNSNEKGLLTPPAIDHALGVYEALDVHKPLQIMVLGLSNDKAKVELWRSEVFYLPDVLTQDNRAYELVEDALQSAEETGRELRKAGFVLAANLLTTGERQPDPNDSARLRDSFPLDAVYWSRLETRFPAFLERFKPGYDAEALFDDWLEELVSAARDAWKKTAQSVGKDARALRAQQEGDRVLSRHINQLRRESGEVAS